MITEKLEEAFAENEEWLAVLGEAVYRIRKTVKDDLKRSQTSRDRRAIDADPSTGSRDRSDSESAWICNVYKGH